MVSKRGRKGRGSIRKRQAREAEKKRKEEYSNVSMTIVFPIHAKFYVLSIRTVSPTSATLGKAGKRTLNYLVHFCYIIIFYWKNGLYKKSHGFSAN